MTVRTKRSGWPILRTPRWMFAGAGVLVAGLVLAAIPHHPSTAQRVTDLRDFVKSVNGDIESCAGGINDSMTALRAIQAGTSHDIGTAVSIANTAAANCSPANNMSLDNLVQYQVHESLASFHLETTVNDLVTWAFPLAQRVELDIGALASASTPAAKASAQVRLSKDQQVLDAERAKIDKAISAASDALGTQVAPPYLPG